MGWKTSKEHVAGRPEFLSLKGNGDTVEFVALTEPDPAIKPGIEKGTSREIYRVFVKATSKDKPQILDMGLRMFEAYEESVGEGHEMKSLVNMTRHGAKGDEDTYYTFVVGAKLTAAKLKPAQAMLNALDKGVVNV